MLVKLSHLQTFGHLVQVGSSLSAPCIFGRRSGDPVPLCYVAARAQGLKVKSLIEGSVLADEGLSENLDGRQALGPKKHSPLRFPQSSLNEVRND